MATKIGSLIISLALESGAFKSGLSAAEKELKGATKRIQAVGASMASVGRNLSLAVTVPMIALAKKSIDGFVAQEAAMADVSAAIKSMGGAAGKTAAELGKTADALELQSLFDAEVILKQVSAQLLTFGNVAGEQFDRAQRAALDMAARLGGEPQSAAIALGKALNDPVKGITALTRVGIQFTAAQKAQIAAMIALGDTAGAQGVILGEVERQFKGAAKAAADANPWRQAQVAIGQAMDQIGKAILPAIKPVTEAIVSIANAFTSLPEPMQKIVVVGGALAAVFGPLLIGLGAIVSATAPFTAAIGLIAGSGGVLTALSAGFTGLLSVLAPVALPLAAVAAAGALIYANWDKIAPVLAEVWAGIQAALGPPLTALMESARAAFDEIAGSELVQNLRTLAEIVGNVGLVLLKAFGGALPGVVKAIGALIAGVLNIVIDTVRLVVAVLSGDWAGAWQAAKDLVQHAIEGIAGILVGLTEALVGTVKGLYQGVKDWIGDKLAAIWESAKRKIAEVKAAFFDLYDAVVGNSYIPDMVDGIAANMARLDAVMVDPALKATAKTGAAFRKLAEEVMPILDRLFPENARKLAFDADFSAIEAAARGGVLNPNAARDALDALQDEFRAGRPEAPVPEIVIALDVDSEPISVIKDINAALDEVSATTGNMAVSFGSVWDAIGVQGAEVTRDLARGLTDVVLHGRNALDVLGQLLDKLASAALDQLFAQILGSVGFPTIPGFASGTSFAPGGVALVGERGPELVNLPRGSKVHTAEATRGMAGGGGGGSIQIVNHNDFRGADASAVAAINARLDRQQRELPGQVLATMNDAKSRFVWR